MSTPPRLNELRCPGCQRTTWVIDADYRGRGGPDPSRGERPYVCAACGYEGPGWHIGRQSPPEFLLQPHALYPMAQEDFDHWVDILRANFPTHRLLAGAGTTFVPYPPQEAAADRAAHAEAHPVAEIRDQDGARRRDPRLSDVAEWIDMMGVGDRLVLHRRDGGSLTFTRGGTGYSAARLDAAGAVRTAASELDLQALMELSRAYLNGDEEGCARELGARARLPMGDRRVPIDK